MFLYLCTSISLYLYISISLNSSLHISPTVVCFLKDAKRCMTGISVFATGSTAIQSPPQTIYRMHLRRGGRSKLWKAEGLKLPALFSFCLKLLVKHLMQLHCFLCWPVCSRPFYRPFYEPTSSLHTHCAKIHQQRIGTYYKISTTDKRGNLLNHML